MKMFGELRLVRALTDEQIAAMRDPKLAATTKLPRIEDAVKAAGFLTGTRPTSLSSSRRSRNAILAWIGWFAAWRSAPRSPWNWSSWTGLRRK